MKGPVDLWYDGGMAIHPPKTRKAPDTRGGVKVNEETVRITGPGFPR